MMKSALIDLLRNNFIKYIEVIKIDDLHFTPSSQNIYPKSIKTL
jgi:hypothetical protein